VARTKIAAQGVTINNILPGKFDTDRIRSTVEATAKKTGQSVADIRAQQQAQVPAGRYGTPQEFGALCAFICSLQASYITGQNFLTDGGAYPGTY
jgi:3-oxoacyl-[acyl-carrier protein] reductase